MVNGILMFMKTGLKYWLIKNSVNIFKKMTHSKILLQNIILVPVVIEMLKAIHVVGVTDFLWVQTVQTMLDKHNLKFSDQEEFEYFRKAQLLLGYPIRQINNEFVEEE